MMFINNPGALFGSHEVVFFVADYDLDTGRSVNPLQQEVHFRHQPGETKMVDSLKTNWCCASVPL